LQFEACSGKYRASEVAQGEGLEFKPHDYKTNKQNPKEQIRAVVKPTPLLASAPNYIDLIF
jgi:hypothetical protein